MTITQASATYKVNVATAGAATVSGNIDYTLAITDIGTIPLMSGATVDPLEMTLTRQPFTVTAIADSVLTTSSGRLTGLGRLIEIQRSLDGAAYATIGTGRISRMSEPDGQGQIDVEVSDESWVGRRARIFETTNSVQLHPPGMAVAWMDLPAAGERTYTVVDTSGDAVRIRPNDEADAPSILFVPVSLRESLARDMLPRGAQANSASNSAGNFTNLRFRYDSADRTVISFAPNLSGRILGVTTPNGLLNTLSPEGSGRLIDAWVYISGHALSATDQITGRFYFPGGAPTSEHVPQHIGGSGGIHPGDLLEDLLDGDYGGPAEAFDATAMTALQALSLRPIWVRETEPADRKDWIRENILKPYGIAPLVGTDLQVRYVQLRLDQNVAPSGLTELNASNATNLRWDHGAHVANIVTVKSRVVRKIGSEYDDAENFPIDEYKFVDVDTISMDHDNTSSMGDVVYEVETSTILERRPNLFSFETLLELATNTFEVFGDGAVTGSVTVAENTSVEVGDQVLIDCDTIKMFNPGAAARTGERAVRLIAFRDISPSEREFDFLDLGPNSAVLGTPTVAVAQDGTDANLFNVTISGLAAGTTAHVECDFGATTPDPFRYAKENVGNETVSFRIPDAHSGNIYARAYATAPNRVRSDWGSDNDAISTRALILEAEVDIVGSRAVVTWDVASTTLGMRTTYDIHASDETPSLGSQTDYDAADGGFTITGLNARDVVSVRLVPYTGWSDPNVSGSAGDPLDLVDTDPADNRGYWLFDVGIPTITLDYAADKGVVVTAGAGKDTAKMYVTVGDGSAPSDPTSGANDGEITGTRGEVDTGQTITPGNDAYVKVVAEDASGNLGPVYTAQIPYLRVVHSTDSTDGREQFYVGSTPTLAGTVQGAENYVGTDDALRLISQGGFIEFEGPTSGSVAPAKLLNSGDRFGPHAVNSASVGTAAATVYTTLHTHTWPGDATFVGGRVDFSGSISGTNDAKGVRVTVGGTSTELFTPAAGDEGDWKVTVHILEITTSSQRCLVEWRDLDGVYGSLKFTRSINTVTTDFVVTLDGLTANASDEVTCDLSYSHSICDGGG